MAMIVACGVILAPKAAMADVSSTPEAYVVGIPTAAAWSINPPGGVTSFSITSQNFTFTGGPAPVAVTDLSLGDPTTPVSYLITNDVGTVEDYDVTLAISDSVGDTTPSFTSATVINLFNGSANINIDLTKTGAATAPTIGGAVFAGSGASLTASATMVDTGTPKMFPIDLKMGIDEASLTEADAPTTLNFELTFTVATVVP